MTKKKALRRERDWERECYNKLRKLYQVTLVKQDRRDAAFQSLPVGATIKRVKDGDRTWRVELPGVRQYGTVLTEVVEQAVAFWNTTVPTEVIEQTVAFGNTREENKWVPLTPVCDGYKS